MRMTWRSWSYPRAVDVVAVQYLGGIGVELVIIFDWNDEDKSRAKVLEGGI